VSGLMERTRVYDELIRRGWTKDEALHIIDNEQKSFTYSQARLMANVRVLARQIADSIGITVRR
jgi:hypothetical protein